MRHRKERTGCDVGLGAGVRDRKRGAAAMRRGAFQIDQTRHRDKSVNDFTGKRPAFLALGEHGRREKGQERKKKRETAGDARKESPVAGRRTESAIKIPRCSNIARMQVLARLARNQRGAAAVSDKISGIS